MFRPALVVFAAVVVILLVGELTRRASLPSGPLAPPTAPNPRMRHILGAMQFGTAVVACFVSLAAALYLLVTAAWTLVQRVALRRRYPLDCQGQPPAAASPG